ncbi:hypothetical protein [Escherichia coli]|uniref:hypothetical protein n=1 Tax=Escherichia coli TaxID=562 RepID=UPI003CE6DFC1
MLGGADNPNGELPSYITGADISEGLSSYAKFAAGAQGSMSQEQTQELFGNATAMSRLMGLSNDELNEPPRESWRLNSLRKR